MPALDILIFSLLSQSSFLVTLLPPCVSLLLPASLTSQRSNLGSGLALMRTDRQTEKFSFLTREKQNGLKRV